MAKKKDTKLDDFNLDDYDLDFHFADEPQPSSKNRNPILDTSVNAVKGFKGTVANKSFIMGVLRKALPKGFVDAYDQAEHVVTKGRELYNGAASDIRPAYNDLERAAREISPIVRGKGKDSLANAIDKIFGKDTATTSSGRFDPDEATISDSMAELFKMQAEDNDKKEQKDRAVEQLKDRTQTRRHSDLMGQQSIMAEGINTLVGYQKQVTSRYQQKMLELNFRQYYAQRDMLGTLQAYARDNHTQMETIIHNTALPDILKMQASEQFANQARARMFGKVQERVGDYFRNYTNKLFDNVEKEVRGFSRQISEGLSMGSQLVDAQRMGMEYDDGSGGSGIGSVAGMGLGHLVGAWAGKHGRRILGRNQKVQDLAARAGYTANNIPEFLNGLRENNRYYGDWRDKALDIGRRILPGPFQRNINLDQHDELFGGGATTFDNQTHRTINEVMPGYLARILQSLESARQGKPVGRLVWNNERNAFTEQKQRTADVASSILDDRKIAGVRMSADAMVARIDPDNKLSAGARKALGDALIREADSGASFSPGKLATGGVDFSQDPKLHREITNHFRDRYQVDSFGKLGKNAENYNRAALDNSSFKMLRETMPDVYATINRMVNTGSTEDLRALGILVPDPNNPRKEIIDYQFIQSRMEGNGWNIHDVTALAANGKQRGRGGKGRPAGQGRQTAPTMAPTAQATADNTQMATLFDRMTTAFQQTWTGVREDIEKLGGRVDALGDKLDALTTKSETAETNLWLSRIAKLIRGIASLPRGGARRRQDWDADADFDEDDDDADGDFWDRTRGRVRRGKRHARTGFNKLKDFTGRSYRKGKLGLRKAVRFGTKQLGVAKDWVLGGRSVFGAVGHAAGTLTNMFQEVFDIYTSPDAKAPVMTAAKMRAGLYFDFYTREPITKFSDIKGPVADEDGNVVLTEEDIRNGLYGKNGKPVGSSLMRGVLSAATGMVARVMGVPGQAVDLAKRVVSKSLSVARNLIDGPEDVYVKGEESPRLLAIIMRRRGYRSKVTGAIIERPSDIDGPVMDLDGNEVLSSEDITKGLVDSKGRNVVGLGGKLLRLAKSGFGLGTKAAQLAMRATRFAWNKAKGAAKAVGRGIASAGRFGGRLLRGLARGVNFQANIGFGVGIGGASVDNVVHGLEAIYNLLDDRLAGKSNFRTGSWQKKFSQSDSPKTVKEKLQRAADGNPILKYLMMFGGAVMSGFAWMKAKFGKFFEGMKGLLSLKRGAGIAGDVADVADAMDDLPTKGKRKGGLLRRAGGLLKRGGRLLAGAGRWALGALPFAGEALAGVGSMAAGLVTAPVAIAAGVAAAGYFAYKYFKGRPDPFQRLRLAEYGFDPSDKDALKKVIEIEGFLLPNVSVMNGRATLNNVNTEELLKRVGIQLTDQQTTRAFIDWYSRRFGPVFLRNVSELKAIAPGVSLMEVDDKLDKSLKADYATATKDTTRDAPYNIGGQPFAELDPLMTGTKAIDEEIASIRKDYAEYRKAPEAKTNTSVSAVAARIVPTTPNMSGKATVDQTTVTPSASEYITPSAQTGGYEPGITVRQWSPGANRLIDDLTAVRMRLYGLTGLDISQVNALTTLESNLTDIITISNDGKVKMSLSPEGIYQQNAGLFGRNPTDLQAQGEWTTWFNYRFLPVYTQFLSALWGINRNIKPGLAWKYLRPEDMLSVADLLKGVRAQTPEGLVSVWSVKAAAFPGTVANTDISSIDSNMTSLQQQVKNNQMQERTPNQNAQSQKQGKGMTTASVTAAQTGAANETSKPGFFQRIKNWFTGNGNAPSAALGGAGFNGQSGSYALGGAGVGGPAAAAMGTPIAQPGNGTGGDINQIPQPDGDGSWDALKRTIVAAANMAGVDPGLMASMAFVESGFRAAVKPGTSQAQGLYQFIPSTWRAMMQKYATKYGIAPNTPPSDPRANALMGAEYLKENQKILEQKLGRPVTGTDLYLSHFLGSAGGPRLLKAPSGDLAQNHADASAVSANRSIFFAGGRPKTVAEVIAWANKRIEGDGGKFMSEANALAGNPQSLKAANQPVGDAANDSSAQSGTGAVSPVGRVTSPDDGQAAFAEGQKQAAAFNKSSTGLPTASPAPMGGGSNTGSGPTAPSGSSDNSSAADYAVDVQTTARAKKQAQQDAGADAMLDVQNQQLEVQKTMSEHLARLVELFEGGAMAPTDSGTSGGDASPGSDTPQAKPNSPLRNGADNRGTKRVNAPISMKRTG
jgi:hypothetical protein